MSGRRSRRVDEALAELDGLRERGWTHEIIGDGNADRRDPDASLYRVLLYHPIDGARPYAQGWGRTIADATLEALQELMAQAGPVTRRSVRTLH